jgi:hypothetical protein
MGLYDRTRATIPGYSAKYVKAEEQQKASDFVQRLRLQQLRLKVDLRNNPATKPLTDENSIKANSLRLDALDRLSLFFCLAASDETTIDGVPLNDEAKEIDFFVRSAGHNQFTIDPYPFRRDPLDFAILARRIPKRRYSDQVDLQKVLSAAPFYNICYTLRSRSAVGSAYAIGA